jgi:hypothetical protein
MVGSKLPLNLEANSKHKPHPPQLDTPLNRLE